MMSDFAIALITIAVMTVGIILCGVLEYFANPDPDEKDNASR